MHIRLREGDRKKLFDQIDYPRFFPLSKEGEITVLFIKLIGQELLLISSIKATKPEKIITLNWKLAVDSKFGKLTLVARCWLLLSPPWWRMAFLIPFAVQPCLASENWKKAFQTPGCS